MALRLGIVGTGKIANKHAVAISMTDKVELAAVASRKLETAEAFSAEHGGEPVQGFEALIARDDIEAIYIATPTGAKEAAAIAALEAGKHVIVDKPMVDAASVRRMTDLARAKGLALMDATHLTHNPRTTHLLANRDANIGRPLSLLSCFHANVGGPENVRFDTALEPYGALGDLGWYCARLVVEFVPEALGAMTAQGSGTFENGALTSVSAVVAFPRTGFRLVMDSSFRTGAFAQDVSLVGTDGIILMDDFVHAWERDRIGEEKPQFKAGYRLRHGRSDPDTVQFIETPAEKSHMILMLEAFADLTKEPGSVRSLARMDAMLATQEILDTIWDSLER